MTEPVGPVQLLPWGLGNMLGLKGDVGIIQALDTELHQQIEMIELLAGKNANETVTDTLSVNAVGSQTPTNLLVPAGETWLVRGGNASAQTTGAELLRYNLLAFGQQTNAFRQLTDTFASALNDGVAAAAPGGGFRCQPFLLYAGESVRVFVQRITTAGTITVTASLQIFRFKG